MAQTNQGYPDMVSTQRSASIGHIILALPEVKKMHWRLDDIRLHGRTATSAESIIISGPNGSGKSQIVQAYQKKFPVEQLPTGDLRPVVYVEAPKLNTEKALAEAVLIALGTRPKRVSSEMHVQEIIRQFDHQKVQLLILDEAHHLAGKDSTLAGTFFKSLLNRGRVPIVFVGMSSTERIIEHSEFQRRCRGVYRVRPFDWFNKDDNLVYRSALRELQRTMRVQPDGFKLCDVEVAARINYACFGLIGHTVGLLRKVEGVCFSEGDGRNTFTMEVLREAYSQLAFGGFQAIEDFKRSPFGNRALPDRWSSAPHEF